MALFRKAPPQDPLIVSMSGARLGQRMLVVPGSDLQVLIDVAAKVGLTGRAFALVPDPGALPRVQERTVQQGVLVDAEPLTVPFPLPDASFDVAIVDDRVMRPAARSTDALLPELARVIRPGGRLLVLVPAPSSPLAGLFGSEASAPDVSGLIRTLGAGGFTAGRLLGVRQGTAFVEAVRPQQPFE
jgi:SAM-dependent methyltransferase